MVNATTDLSRRQFYATHGQFGPAPRWFKHATLGGKPSPPSTTSLTADELAQFNAWLEKRENGTITPMDLVNVYPAVQAMMATYETYYAGADVVNWAHDDLIGREMQWRVRCADVLDAVEAAGSGVLPISSDPTGAGANSLSCSLPQSSN